LIKAYPTKEFHVISIYLSPRFTEYIIQTFSNNKNPTNIFFTTLFFNDFLAKYHQYIERGGVMIGDDEGDFNSQVMILKKENFVEYFRNLWKNHF
jgi:hypothetical protein